MGWQDEINANRETLKSIIMLLFSMARLAALASIAPEPLRAYLLRILHRAEAAGRAVIINEARSLGVRAAFEVAAQVPDPTAVQSSRAEAERLGHCFTVMALAVINLMEMGEWVYGEAEYAPHEALPIAAAIRSSRAGSCALPLGLGGRRAIGLPPQRAPDAAA